MNNPHIFSFESNNNILKILNEKLICNNLDIQSQNKIKEQIFIYR